MDGGRELAREVGGGSERASERAAEGEGEEGEGEGEGGPAAGPNRREREREGLRQVQTG